MNLVKAGDPQLKPKFFVLVFNQPDWEKLCVMHAQAQVKFPGLTMDQMISAMMTAQIKETKLE